MSNDYANLSEFDKDKAIKDLMEDLNQFGNSTNQDLRVEEEALDLIVDQAVNGIDIRNRFPEFYKKLLHNQFLRQQFLDALSFLNSIKQSIKDPYLHHSKLDLSFLTNKPLEVSNWPIFITQDKAHLMNLFFPKEPVYRGTIDLGATPTYSLLRRDFLLAGVTYSLLIDSTLSEESKNALSATLALATNDEPGNSAFPVQATLRWGEYSSEISIDQEGKYPLPDIPLSQVFDDGLNKVKADLFLTLSSSSH